MKQTKFEFAKEKLTHGGNENKGKRKGVRPISVKRPMHLVLKCSRRVFAYRLLVVDTLIPMANKFGVRLYSFAVAHDHLHVVARMPSRAAYKKFIRAFTGVLARRLGAKLFAAMLFSRIASWGRDYLNLLFYMQKNWDETQGNRAYEPRGRIRKKAA